MRLLCLLASACVAPAATTWTDVPATHDAVDAAARDARARGLAPVLYLRADYTMASARLVALRDTPAMRDALRGLAVIAIDPVLDDGAPFAELRRGYWHSFHALDATAELDAGTKNGPCAVSDTACVEWVRTFAVSVRR